MRGRRRLPVAARGLAMGTMRVFPAVLLACSAFGCVSSSEAPLLTKAPFVVDDGFIKDEDGRVVILRGVNLSGKHKNAPYFDFHTEADVAVVRDRLGMNSLRFLIEWAAVEPRAGVYDDAYLDGVAERIGWARDHGLLVVLDMHQDIFGEGFPGGNGAPRWACDDARYAAFAPPDQWFFSYLDENVVACFDNLWNSDELQEHYAQAWHHVAERLKGFDNVIGFDVMNEPWLASYGLTDFEPRALQPFYERVVPAVRSAAPHWLAFLEPMSMSNLGRETQLVPFPFDNVVYAPHSYDSSAEQGEGFSDGNREDILQKLVNLKAEADALGAALWIGEYGGVADHPGITPYMDAEYDAFAQVFAGSTYWDYSRSDGYGVVNLDGSEKPALWDVLVRPFPERIAGTPRSWSYDEGSGVFAVSYEGNGGVSVVVVPARAYDGGFDVEVSGGSATVTGERVEVAADAGADVEVIVTPK